MRGPPRHTTRFLKAEGSPVCGPSFEKGQPFEVADKIVEIVQSKTWKLRHTVGLDAEPMLEYRDSMTDEQWVDMQSVESDQKWPAIVKRDFGVDVELF